MRNQKPSFEITNEIVNQVIEVAELAGRLAVLERFTEKLALHRRNRIRMIHGSLALEQNALTLEQAAAVLNGRRMIAPLRDVTELKNAWEAYEELEKLDPFSMDALLETHRTMMHSLEGEAGVFRAKKVNVVDESGQILHFGTLPDYYSKLAAELLEWVEGSDLPMLVKSCVFRYEFERIHPFANGTGRIGRLWHTVLLAKWNPLFAWVPVDAVIQERQAEYYKAINAANDAGNASSFIHFLLISIKASLNMVIDEIDGCKMNVSDEYKVSDEKNVSDEANESELPTERSIPRWEEVRQFMATHELIRNADIRMLFDVSPATANRILAGLAAEGKLVKCHEGGHWAYRLRT